MGMEEFKWCQPAHHKLWSQQRPHFSPHSISKTNAHSLGRMISSGISDVMITSVHSEKTRLKKLMMRILMIIITNKSQETTVLAVARKLLLP